MRWPHGSHQGNATLADLRAAFDHDPGDEDREEAGEILFVNDVA